MTASIPNTARAEIIRRLQDEVNHALLAGDWRKLQELVSPDARIIGPRGFEIDRDVWIDVHQSNDYVQGRLDASETSVQAYDNAGIRVDVMDSECTYKGEKITGHFRVLQSWRRATARGSWSACNTPAFPMRLRPLTDHGDHAFRTLEKGRREAGPFALGVRGHQVVAAR
jgi:hypothetical protein